MLPEALGQTAAAYGAKKERDEGHERVDWWGDHCGPSEREAQEDDVASHVRHEDVAELQEAHSVDQTGDEGEVIRSGGKGP